MLRSKGGAILVVEGNGCGLELTEVLRACQPEIEWASTVGHAFSRLNRRPFCAVAVGGACSDDEVHAFLGRLAEDGIAVPVFVLHDRQDLVTSLPACVTCSPRSDWRGAVRAWAATVAAAHST